MDYSPPGSSVRGISQVRILECLAIPFSRDQNFLAQGSNPSPLCLLHCRRILYSLCHYQGSDFELSLHMTAFRTLSNKRRWNPSKQYLPKCFLKTLDPIYVFERKTWFCDQKRWINAAFYTCSGGVITYISTSKSLRNPVVRNKVEFCSTQYYTKLCHQGTLCSILGLGQ